MQLSTTETKYLVFVFSEYKIRPNWFMDNSQLLVVKCMRMKQAMLSCVHAHSNLRTRTCTQTLRTCACTRTHIHFFLNS